MIKWERTSQVWGICGNLGGGKTLSGVGMAVDALERGWFVVTNVEFNHDSLSRRLGYDSRKMVLHVDMDATDPMSWPCGSPRGSGGNKRVIVLLDEVAEWFDQYSSGSNQVKHFLSWLRHTSKRSQDVVLIVQRKEYLAKSLRILVSRWVWVEDMAVWRMPWIKIHVPFCSGLCMRNVRDRVNNLLQNTDFIRKSEYGQYYQTAQCLVSGAGEAVQYGDTLTRRDDTDPLDLLQLALAVACLLLLAWASL